ncbi:hypothetical protein H8E07_12625 [bacterium]|nr:hypothetical protein [bacterium]
MNRTAALSVLMILACGAAVAQPIDPDPDGMSIYFDESGSTYCLTVDDWVPMIGAGPTINIYLLVTRPSTPLPYIQGWEAHVEIMMNSYTPTTSLTPTPGAIDLAKEPDDYVVVADGDAAIQVGGDTVILATAELAWLGFEGHAEAWLLLRGVEGSQLFPVSPGYYSDESEAPTPCQALFGGWGRCIWVNGDCHWWTDRLVDESLTWGEVKSLY